MLKTPKTKDITKQGKQALSLVGGAMISRGVNNVIPVEDSTMKKAIVAGGSLVLAAMYKGPQKDIVNPALVGMAAYQTVDIISGEVGKQIQRKEGATAIEKFGYDALGLAGTSCGCNQPATTYPMALGAPRIQRIEWNEAYNGEQVEEAEYSEIGSGV